MFFKHDDFTTFTSNSSKYRCDTVKTFVDHDGKKHTLKFSSGSKVDKIASGLQDTDEYTIRDISFTTATNKLSYNICYKPIVIASNKFVFNDVEYFITDEHNHLYFNEFQKEMQAKANEVKISNNEFELDGIQYKIENEVLKVEVNGEFKVNQNIIDGKFKIDGVHYILIKEGSTYKKLRYARVDDNLLVKIDITTNGVAEYASQGLKFLFEFEDGFTKVNVVKAYSITVNDYVIKEWCEFDEDNQAYSDWIKITTSDII